jgi:hypothetical protein
MNLDKKQIKEIGINQTLLLTILKKKSKSIGEFFPYAKENLMIESEMKRGKLNSCLQKLKNAGYIETKLIGAPPITNFKILK